MGKTIVAALAVAAVFSLAGWHGRGCGGGAAKDPAAITAAVDARLEDALKSLDATPAQRVAIQGLKDKLLADGLQLREGQAAAHQALLAEWKATSPDRNRVHAILDERAAAMTAMAHEAADAALQLHDLLTPEQRAKVEGRLERFHH
jgi:Spy/CpxP family protein refolding chaperone